MKLFILITHYLPLSLTIKDYLLKMMPINNQLLKIEAIGGINNGKEIGTEPLEIQKIIDQNSQIEDIFIFSDLGSATLAAQTIAMLIPNKNIYISRGAIVENTFAAYVAANTNASFEDVKKACEEVIKK